MKRAGALIVGVSAFLAMASFGIASAQTRQASSSARHAGEASRRGGHEMDVPQAFVVCTGWHALCTASPDCRMAGDRAGCDCMRVDETHIVATGEIQDPVVKRLTETRCTEKDPCDVDRAPICKAIRDGTYRVDDVRYDWVSTYSYRGWCSILQLKPKACDPGADDYTGDRSWAICDAAPCTENPSPSDPERPLTCQCRVDRAPFVGMNDSCTGARGGIMSSMPLWAWDFENETYPFPMPGYEYVRGACAPLRSDPAPELRRDRGAR